MNPRATQDDRDVRLIATALRAPLPPARLTADPSALWACGRHARRIATEARIGLVITGAQIAGLLGVLAVLVAFVDWPAVWSVARTVSPLDAGVAVALAVVAVLGARRPWRALLRPR